MATFSWALASEPANKIHSATAACHFRFVPYLDFTSQPQTQRPSPRVPQCVVQTRCPRAPRNPIKHPRLPDEVICGASAVIGSLALSAGETGGGLHCVQSLQPTVARAYSVRGSGFSRQFSLLHPRKHPNLGNLGTCPSTHPDIQQHIASCCRQMFYSCPIRPLLPKMPQLQMQR
jgi:hypothetical protein